MSNKRTPIGSFIHSSWTNLNIRCGKYAHLQTKDKCKVYKNIKIEFTREEYKNWCIQNKDKILSLSQPSLDRINSDGNYTLDNIQVIELTLNIKRKRPGTAYLNGPKEKALRGIKKSGNKWIARITTNGYEKHIGTFNSKKEAYFAFWFHYKNVFGKEPFDLSLIEE